MSSFKIRNINDIKKIEEVPYRERFTAKSTFELLEKGAAINPNAPAINFIESGEKYDQPITISYDELIGKIRQTANLFNDLGAGPEDVITYLLPNIVQTHYVLWGAETAAIVNPVNPLLETAAIADTCLAVKTKIIVTVPEFLKKVEQIRSRLPDLKHVVIIGSNVALNGDILFENEINRYASSKLSFDRAIEPDAIASIYHTGGTTGTPKLAKRTHYNEIFITQCTALIVNMSKSNGTALSGLPLYHCNATMLTGLTPFSVGKSVTLLSSSGYRNPSIIQAFYKIVETYEAFMFTSVPTVLVALLNVPVDADISSLEYTNCGAAPLSVELFKRFEKKTPIKILEGYGLTESTVAAAVNPINGERKIGSVGLAFPYVDIKIKIIDEHGHYIRDARTNEIGNICIKGPNIFSGYVEGKHNQGIFIDGYFDSGDLGRMDEDHYIWLTGRRKELIIRGGHNIDPGGIEDALYKLDGIQLAAAVGQPDAYAGEIPVAYVQLADNCHLSEQKILNWAQQNIAEKAAVPKKIIVMDTIPLTPVGKIFKPALRYDAIERSYERQLQALYDEDLVASVSVKAQEDKVTGTKVLIVVKPKAKDTRLIEDRITKLLSHFSIPFDYYLMNS